MSTSPSQRTGDEVSYARFSKEESGKWAGPLGDLSLWTPRLGEDQQRFRGFSPLPLSFCESTFIRLLRPQWPSKRAKHEESQVAKFTYFYNATQCYAMLCYTKLYYTILYYTIIRASEHNKKVSFGEKQLCVSVRSEKH